MLIKSYFSIFSWEVSKLLSANQILAILKQLYLKKNWVSQLDILHADRDSRKVTGD